MAVAQDRGMLGALHRRARRGVLSGLLSVGALAAILVGTQDIDLPGLAGRAPRAAASTSGVATSAAPCGSASAATVAHVDESVARRIYVAELRGYEVRADLAHIRGSTELRAALQSSNQAAVYAAVHNIVYTPHWHIVRLRVLQHGRVLADVGGPHVIAPVSGVLRSNGKPLASFVMSVQDDLGYTKLVTRFIGAPVELYQEGSPVMGTFPAPLAAPRNGQSLRLAGARYWALVLSANAFPSGKLEAALLVAVPSSTLDAATCEKVRGAAWGSIATHVASRFAPPAAHYEDFVHTLQGVSGGRVFIRSGSARLAGGGPLRLPQQGRVRYRGLSWDVFSWVARAPTRIYFLTPLA
jgi:hypothetical protein